MTNDKTAFRTGDVSKEAQAHRLKVVREAFNLTQVQLAEIAGMNENAYRHHESGRSYLTPLQVERIRNKIDVDHNFIYTGRTDYLTAGVYKKLIGGAEAIGANGLD